MKRMGLACASVQPAGAWSAAVVFLAASALGLAAQDGVIEGSVTTVDAARPLEGVTITVEGTRLAAVSGLDGRFTLRGVPPGSRTLHFRRIGYRPETRTVEVVGAATQLELTMTFQPIPVAEISVTGPSRVPERLIDAPAAVSKVDLPTARALSITGQPGLAVATLPGVDVVETDVQDININTRGFNTVFTRRVLVLQDGRDLAITFLGSQEWLGMSTSLRDMSDIELVRGPVAALYGANAFAGVLNIATPPARETPGTSVSAAGGELSTLRADFRHGGLISGGEWAYRLTGGYYRSDMWARARTNVGDLAEEYRPAIGDEADEVMHPFPGFELRPLIGQDKEGPAGFPGAALGEPDPLTSAFGTLRLDRYGAEGSILTFEGGAARAENAVLVGSAARFQVGESWRPWARVAWDGQGFQVNAWYSGRLGRDEYNLAAGTVSRDDAHTFHVEAQRDLGFADGRGQVVLGGSFRSAFLDSDGTVLDPRFDGRTDRYYAAFGQGSYEILPELEVIVALRIDESDLFTTQLSPRGSLVYQPTPDQAIRFTVGRAFEQPNILDFFVAFPAGPPADFTLLEAGLRTSAIGPLLDGVPQGELFTDSRAIPVLALGNPDLDVERVTSWELGYKGQFGRLFVSADAYYSLMDGFVTDVLPGVNPSFGPWTAPEGVAPEHRAAVEAAVGQTLAAADPFAAAALTRLEDGSTAIVLSIGNAGRAKVGGLELASSLRVTDEVELAANYTFFDFDLDASAFVAGDVVLPNTPRHKGNVSLRYRGRQGLQATASVRLRDAYDWSAGTFTGPVPSSQYVDVSASYPLTRNLRLDVVGTNVFDQRRYHNFGGAVIGRRILGGLTATF